MPLHSHTHTRKTAGQGEGGTAPTWGTKKNIVDPQRGTLRAWAAFFAGLQNLREKIKKKRKENETEIVGKTCAGSSSSSWRRGGQGQGREEKTFDRSIGKLHKKLQGCRRRTVAAPFFLAASFGDISPLSPPSPTLLPLPCPCLVAFPCVCRWLSAQRLHTRLLFYGIVDWWALGEGGRDRDKTLAASFLGSATAQPALAG